MKKRVKQWTELFDEEERFGEGCLLEPCLCLLAQAEVRIAEEKNWQLQMD